MVGVHSVQAPARGPVCWHAGRVGSGQLGVPSAVQGTQLWVVGLQFGVMPPQSASLRHPSQTPTPLAVSHSGREVGQCAVFVAVQTAQAPLGRHSGAAAGHSASAVQGRQVAVGASQTGRVGAQAATFPGPHCAQAPDAVQTGVWPGHSASRLHGRQTWFTPSQMGAAPLQSAFAMQATQWPAAVSHTAVAPEQIVLFVAEQLPQAPLGWQAGVAPEQSPSPPHARQVWVVGSQVGVAPAHCDAITQATQFPVDVSQVAVVPVHFVVLVAEHVPQAPFGWQAGVTPPHSPSPLQPRQACVVASQVGVAPAHWAPDKQPTQVPVATLQTGVAPMQWMLFVAEQPPQAPLDWQAGVAPPHSASAAHPRQVCVVPSQAGVVAWHCAAVTQPTQVAVGALHTGVAPVQSAAFVAEQVPQEPFGWQAGVAPPHSPSPAHPRQVCVVASQAGVPPPHCADVTQATHVPLETLHTGVVPAQRVALPAEQTPQEPSGWQAGVAPPQSLSPPQARQIWKAGSQTGVAPPQSAAVKQPTQMWDAVLQTGVGAAQVVSFTQATHWAAAT